MAAPPERVPYRWKWPPSRLRAVVQIFPSGASWPATRLVYPNGTYLTEADGVKLRVTK